MACSGPCNQPAILSVSLAESGPLIQTNFGLLRSTADGWFIECEEVIGGLLLVADSARQWIVASTDHGVFIGDEQCDWRPGFENVGWMLDVLLTSSGDVYGLWLDRDSAGYAVLHHVEGSAPTTVGVFAAETGLVSFQPGGDVPTVLGKSAEAGQLSLYTLAEDAENWPTLPVSMNVAGYDWRVLPDTGLAPNELWLKRTSLSSATEEVWLVDVSSGQATSVFAMPDDRTLVGIATLGERTYVAGAGSPTSTLFTWERGQEPEPLAQIDTRLSCLTAVDDRLMACGADFSRDSPWLVASSQDEGVTWTPLLRLTDLPGAESCGEICESTTAWLDALGEALAESPAMMDEAQWVRPERTDETSGGCSTAGRLRAAHSDVFGCLGFGLLLLLAQRRSHHL